MISKECSGNRAVDTDRLMDMPHKAYAASHSQLDWPYFMMENPLPRKVWKTPSSSHQRGNEARPFLALST